MPCSLLMEFYARWVDAKGYSWVKASSYTRSWYCYTKSGHTVGSFRNWPQQAWPLAAWLWSCFKKLCSLYRKLAGCKIYWNKIRMLCQPRCTTWDLDWQRRAQPAQLRDAVLAARKNWMRIQLFFFFSQYAFLYTFSTNCTSLLNINCTLWRDVAVMFGSVFLWHVQSATIALDCRSCRGSSNVNIA